ncbi:hypothetical protein CPB83DRAFT_900921 [Crepidotus variabilis]|uniref:Uncharacterized protein n=1 Tax=Crepidotus variabilis TaxID=179855 RepID=A0A9P6BCM3_9AGAR|nr:hypothetical protein CPB83DRAFT_900921 [Crepidotus variabilis]
MSQSERDLRRKTPTVIAGDMRCALAKSAVYQVMGTSGLPGLQSSYLPFDSPDLHSPDPHLMSLVPEHLRPLFAFTFIVHCFTRLLASFSL